MIAIKANTPITIPAMTPPDNPDGCGIGVTPGGEGNPVTGDCPGAVVVVVISVVCDVVVIAFEVDFELVEVEVEVVVGGGGILVVILGEVLALPFADHVIALFVELFMYWKANVFPDDVDTEFAAKKK